MTTEGHGTFCTMCDWLDSWPPNAPRPGDPKYMKCTDPELIRARHKQSGECPDTNVDLARAHGRARPGAAAAA